MRYFCFREIVCFGAFCEVSVDMTAFFLVAGFSLLITSGVLVYDSRVSAETQQETFGLSSIPIHISAMRLAAFGLTLLGSVGIGSNLVPIKAQASDRIHDHLTYRPGFVNFNHRVVPKVD